MFVDTRKASLEKLFHSQKVCGLSSSEIMPSDLSFSQKVINLCSEYFPNSSFLLVPTNDGSITEIDISDNHYKLSIKKLTCRENEYERALKMNLYDDDKWTFDVRKEVKKLIKLKIKLCRIRLFL